MGRVNRLLGLRVHRARRWLPVGLALAVLGVALWLARPGPPSAAVGALYLVDDTTLAALQGDVQLQPAGGASFGLVEGKRDLHSGDRVRTGTDGYASIVYADGSSTSLDPDTELALQNGSRDPATGLATIAFEQSRGTAWTVTAARGAPLPAVEIVSPAGRFVARGGQFTTTVALDGTLAVAAVAGTVEGRTTAGDVDLPSGFTTRMAPGQAPSVPVPAAAPLVTLQVGVQGPVSALLTDARGRSVGYHPAAEAYVSQIPGARLRRGDRGAQVFTVPAPVESYTLTLRGQAPGQVVVDVSALRGDGADAGESAHVEARVGERQILATSFAWRSGAVTDVQALAPAAGSPPNSVVLLLAQPPPAVLLGATSAPPVRAPATPTVSETPRPGAAALTDEPEAGETPAEAVAATATAAPTVGVVAAPPPAPPPTPAPAPPTLVAPAAAGAQANGPGSAAVSSEATAVPLAVGVVLTPPTPEPPPTLPPTAPPATPAPATPRPPTRTLTVAPPTAAPTPTPTLTPSAVPRTVISSFPAIAPTATPYRPPVAPAGPLVGTPTRCLYPSC